MFPSHDRRGTDFSELVIAIRSSKFNFKPTWGLSDLRDATTASGTGAAVVETSGEFKLSTGTASGNTSQLRTKERGQYQAGTEGEAGIGVRIPTAPTGTQCAEWGYFDDNNGFGYGYDATGLYVFRLSAGTKTKIYQSSWNADKVDGTGSASNPSGFNLNVANGLIFQINFTWYGYGSVKFYINTRDTEQAGKERILLHRLIVDESISVVDPNQPITINAINGDTTSTNFDVYVGGRQFSVVDGDSLPEIRDTPIIFTNETVGTTLIPILAVRKKANFNGRQNSIRCILKQIDIATSQNMLWFFSYGDTVTDGSWGAIPYVDATETALEINTTLTAGNTTQFRAISGDAIVTGKP
jgi:hypothetical protein